MGRSYQNIKLIVFVILFWCSNNVFAQLPYPSEKQGPPTAQQIIKADEYLKFEVKYSFLKLAWVELEAIRDTVIEGDTLSYLRSIVRTNSRVPFMDEDIDYYNSIIYVNEDNKPVTHSYWKDNVDANKFREYDYFFDRELNQVRFDENGVRDTLDLVEPATSGLIIFLWSRMFAGTETPYDINVYVSKEQGKIHAENFPKKEKRKVIAFDDQEFDTYYSNGQAEVNGPFGFSGDFEGWFLADDLRIPVEIRAKVFLGKVKIRLIEYRRGERNEKN
ncbi:MAG: DUF3108 domain-containing protein [Balneola sp.]